MKKSVLYIILACALLMLTSCGKQNDLSEAKAADNENSVVESSSQDFIEEVSKENHIEVNDEATVALARVSEVSKKVFAEAEGEWMYGYKGDDTVYNENCCVFTVYTRNDDSNTKQGVVAVATDCEKVFVFNEERGCYVMAEIDE